MFKAPGERKLSICRRDAPQEEQAFAEYGLRLTFEPIRFEFARWIAAKCPAERDGFIQAHPASMARDLHGAPVFLAASAFDLKYEQDTWPEIVFSDIKDN